MLQEPKYVLYPGWVRSQVDGQDHYVNTGQLAALYKVPMCECLCLPSNLPEVRRTLKDRYANLPALRPRFDGDYRHPSQYPEGELK